MQIILFGAGPFAVSSAAVLSGMGTAALVLLLALKGRVTGGYRLVLVGIGVGWTLAGVNTVLLVASNLNRSISAQLWLAGSLTARSWSHAVPAALSLTLIVPIALLYARRLALLEMGDDAASQLGVAVERTRLATVMTAVGLTAMATAATGPIAFIALAGPQLARRLCRSPDVPLVSGAIMGAVLLLAADLISQRFPYGLNLPIGLTTGLLGRSICSGDLPATRRCERVVAAFLRARSLVRHQQTALIRGVSPGPGQALCRDAISASPPLKNYSIISTCCTNGVLFFSVVTSGLVKEYTHHD